MASRLHIVHVIPTLGAADGGPSRSVPQLCRALCRAGVDVTLYTTGPRDGDLTIQPDREPFRTRVFPARRPTTLPGLRLGAALRSHRHEIAVAHIHSLWNPVISAAARSALHARIPYVLAPRGMLDPECLSRRRLLKALYARTIDRGLLVGAARVHCLNRAEARGCEQSGFALPPTFLAPNGSDVDTTGLRPGSFRSRHPRLASARIMAFLGRLHVIKGLALQLEALARLASALPDLVWVLAGPDRGQWATLSAQAAALGLRDRVVWVGALDDREKLDFLVDADVFVQTSHYECHSVAVNEALAVGVPCVVTTGVHFDEVQKCGAGLVVPAAAEPVAAAIAAILRDPARSASMRLAGRSFAAQHLSWDRIAAQVVAVYEEIVAERGNGRVAPGSEAQSCVA